MENIDIDIDIDKEILENIDKDKILNQLEFGISNRATSERLLIADYILGSAGSVSIFHRKALSSALIWRQIPMTVSSTKLSECGCEATQSSWKL